MTIVRNRSGGTRTLCAALALGIAATALAGCSRHGGPVQYGVKNFGAPDEPTAADFLQVYHIGPRDVLTVSVYQVPSMSGDLQVDLEGNIELPLLGKVSVVGKTEDEAAKELAARLGEKYLQSPQVRVAVKDSSRQRITVDGAVNNGGLFPINGTTTLMQAIALARGTTDSANLKRVIVFRTIDGQRMAAAFDLVEIRRGQSSDPTIYGNDIIVVDSDQWRTRFRDLVQSIPLVALFRPF